MDYKTVFINLCLELQQNRSWIKGLGKNPFTHSLTAVPFVRGHRSVFPRTPRNTGVYTRHPTFVTATSACLHAVRHAVGKKIACIHCLRSEGVKTLTPKVFWLETFRNPPKSSSALLETCPYIQNAPCVFVDLSYLIVVLLAMQ